MTFEYKIPRSRKFTGGIKAKVSNEAEVLLGVLQGKKVPQDEERFFRGAMKTGRIKAYYVQFDLGMRGKPGYRTLDALVNTWMEWRAFEIDGIAFVHRGDAKKAEDRLHDLQRIEHLRKLGITLRRGIEHVPDSRLTTQEQADKTARNLLR